MKYQFSKTTQQAIQRYIYRYEQLFLLGFSLNLQHEKSIWVVMSSQQTLTYIPTGAGAATRWPTYLRVEDIFGSSSRKILVQLEDDSLWLQSIDKLDLDNIQQLLLR